MSKENLSDTDSEHEKPEPIKRRFKIAEPISVALITGILTLFGVSLGWMTQLSTTSATVKKDYVQMAIQILREPRRDHDEDIRQWAIAMVNKNAPVLLSEKAANQLSVSASLMGWMDNLPLLSAIIKRHQTCPAVDLSTIAEAQRKDIESLVASCSQNSGDLALLKTYLKMLKGSATAP